MDDPALMPGEAQLIVHIEVLLHFGVDVDLLTLLVVVVQFDLGL
jgi:hypothetical protein